MNIRTITAVVAVGCLGLAGCSSDDSADDSTSDTTMMTTTTEKEETTTTMAEEAPAEEADIVDTAVAAGDFSTLVTAVQAAGLEETLRGDGPFTVFAPTDEAFAALPAGTLDTLLADPTNALAPILTYHVVAGEVLAADVVGLAGQSVATVNGANVTVNVDGDKVSLTDATGNTVNVIATDVTTSNGVIHVIDGVLLPG